MTGSAKTGPNAKDPNSKTQKRINRRTAENMRPEMLERRDLFIEGLLLGMSKREAAVYAGVPDRSSAKEGSTMWCEPYVQQKYRELREAMEEEQLLTRKELILNVKQIAFDARAQEGARVSASGLLAKVMGYEAPAKVEVKHAGNVMMVPLVAGVDDWETAANASQQKLKDDVRT